MGPNASDCSPQPLPKKEHDQKTTPSTVNTQKQVQNSDASSAVVVGHFVLLQRLLEACLNSLRNGLNSPRSTKDGKVPEPSPPVERLSRTHEAGLKRVYHALRLWRDGLDVSNVCASPVCPASLRTLTTCLSFVSEIAHLLLRKSTS